MSLFTEASRKLRREGFPDGLTPSDRSTYLLLLHYWSAERGAFPTHAELASVQGSNEQTVKTSLRRLRECGLLSVRDARRNRPTVYDPGLGWAGARAKAADPEGTEASTATPKAAPPPAPPRRPTTRPYVPAAGRGWRDSSS